MSARELEARLAAATTIAREAGKLALEWWTGKRALGTTFKGRHDFLTQADGAVEVLVRERLAAAFPGDAFVGEEGGGAGGTSQWVVDPIDGTSNFATGVADWCVSIGYREVGIAKVGVIFAPVLGELYAARTGGGAFKNDARIAVMEPPTGGAILDIDWGNGISKADYFGLVGRVVDAGLDFRRAGSAALALARVAAGARHGYLQLWTKTWDAMAGVVIVREAGGVTNPFEDGVDLKQGNPILATTPGLGALVSRLSGIPLRA
ncbi:MAG: inositol monophosphatase [Rhodospirillales bacterium]|nr:inositol monophosphatase [Rhodospirillales bacterium]